MAGAVRGARTLLARARLDAKARQDPRVIARIVLGVLVALNLAAAVVAFKPFGGSPEDLARHVEDLHRQLALRRAGLTRSKALAAKTEAARSQGDQFLSQYVLNRRTASSAIVSELNDMAKQAGIKSKGESFGFEAIEGSDTLSMLTVAAGYEGTYQSLTRFINLLDRSPRFLIVESLQAAPQQGGAVLSAMIKFNAFVRDDAGRALALAVRRAPQPAADQAPPQTAEPAAVPVLSAPPAPAVQAPGPPPNASVRVPAGNGPQPVRGPESAPAQPPLPFTPTIGGRTR